MSVAPFPTEVAAPAVVTGSPDRRGPLDVRRLGLHSDPVDYVETWELQRLLAGEIADGTREDAVLLLEHRAVYTAGKRTEPKDRPDDGTPVVDVDRGGSITWHGPGQLVGYPLVRLPEPLDVVGFVRLLEGVMLATCADLGIEAQRVEGRSGVWLPADHPLQGTRPERKIGAIGLRVARGVTMHGFALNADCDLGSFDRIVPCGISDVGVTSLTAELGRRVSVTEVADVLQPHLERVLGDLRGTR